MAIERKRPLTGEVDKLDLLSEKLSETRDELYDLINDIAKAQIREEKETSHLIADVAELKKAVLHIKCLRDDKFIETDKRLTELEEELKENEQTKASTWRWIAGIVAAFVVPTVLAIISYATLDTTVTAHKERITSIVERQERSMSRGDILETKMYAVEGGIVSINQSLKSMSSTLATVQSDIAIMKERRRY